MEDLVLEQLKYPIGHFVKPATINPLLVMDWIAHIEALPVNLVGSGNPFIKGAARYTLPSRGLDSTTGGASPGRQSSS